MKQLSQPISTLALCLSLHNLQKMNAFHQGQTILQLKETEGKVRQAPVSNLMKFSSQSYKPSAIRTRLHA
jgi:cobalamin biosynthesis Co2+ chelatase CbiK